MKNLFIALFAIMTLPVFAGWSGNVGMYSEYFYRGVSQSNGDSAVQISAQYDHWIDDSNAFYGGVWASSVEFVDNPASQEYDFCGLQRAHRRALQIDGFCRKYRCSGKCRDARVGIGIGADRLSRSRYPIGK